MSEHTPGPWIAVERDATEQPVRCMPRISVGQPVESGGPGFEQCVAWIVPRMFGGSQHEANASLIAAAPDLLAELEDMTNVAEKAIIASGTDSEFAAIRVERARAAIAKAKGRP